MSKKKHEVGEPGTPYPVKKPVKAAIPIPKKPEPGDAEFKRISGKLLSERKELLHKLAQ